MVETAAGDTVTGGTIALSGRLVVRAVQVGPEQPKHVTFARAQRLALHGHRLEHGSGSERHVRRAAAAAGPAPASAAASTSQGVAALIAFYSSQRRITIGVESTNAS